MSPSEWPLVAGDPAKAHSWALGSPSDYVPDISARTPHGPLTLIRPALTSLYLSSNLPALSFMPCSVLETADTRGPSSKPFSPSVPGEGSHSLHALVQSFPASCFPFPHPHCGQDRLFYHVLPGQSPNFSGVPGPSPSASNRPPQHLSPSFAPSHLGLRASPPATLGC